MARVNTDEARVTWKKSTRSNGSGDCVEVAQLQDGSRLVRDSKDPDGAILTFTPSEWRAFLDGAKDGEFD
jgi:hypothetical protein